MKCRHDRLLYSRILNFSRETKRNSFEIDVSDNQIIILSELNHESNQICVEIESKESEISS